MKVKFLTSSKAKIAKAVGDEIGEVQNSYETGGEIYHSVIFPIYGAQVNEKASEFEVIPEEEPVITE